jgi:putative PIN family toxin of toxin-antitoxin system
VDTNVWVSALLNKMGAPARILSAYLAQEIQIISSEPLLQELREVLLRKRFSRKYGITKIDVDSYVELIGERANVVEITGQAFGCSDPDDEMVVETAIVGKAHAVVSGDPDLTEDETIVRLLHKHGVAILDPRRFVDALWPG